MTTEEVRFDDDLYAVIRDGCIRSAQYVAPVVYGIVRPESVIDVGCGEGWWASAFAAFGASRVEGVELERPRHVASGIDALHKWDLSTLSYTRSPDLGRFDLAVCLECAEHLPAEAAQPLVDWLCALAPVVLFSAAVPEQGGAGHLNEQWPDYWFEMFRRNGYAVTGELRWKFWGRDYVEPWYQQNLLLAASVESRVFNDDHDKMFSRAHTPPPSVVHPTTFLHRACRDPAAHAAQ